MTAGMQANEVTDVNVGSFYEADCQKVISSCSRLREVLQAQAMLLQEPDFPCDRLGDRDETAGWSAGCSDVEEDKNMVHSRARAIRLAVGYQHAPRLWWSPMG